MGLWKEIKKEAALFNNNCIFVVGVEEEINFGCKGAPLSMSFPSLYTMTNFIEMNLSEVWDLSREGEN